MQALLVQGLQAIGKLLDKAVPLQGGRTILVTILVIVTNVAGFLSGQIQGELAASNILLALGTIYASVHKPTP